MSLQLINSIFRYNWPKYSLQELLVYNVTLRKMGKASFGARNRGALISLNHIKYSGAWRGKKKSFYKFLIKPEYTF